MKEIKIDGEKIYLKKDFMGWRTIFPLKNSDGSFNWFNFVTGGSWYKFIILIIIILFILFSAWAYNRDTKVCRQLIENYQSNLNGIDIKNGEIFAQNIIIEGREEDLFLYKLLIKEVNKIKNDSDWVCYDYAEYFNKTLTEKYPELDIRWIRYMDICNNLTLCHDYHTHLMIGGYGDLCMLNSNIPSCVGSIYSRGEYGN